ncbi:MAG: hypothetical protein N4A61_12460 [Pelagimonas sp.]|jgi:hypothetical protein|nr:hypothetical protein [Pelagimonas sp.]
MSDGLQRPELTLPEAEAALLRRAYEAAGVVLEYGSGGSTVMAAEMPGTRVTSVESDLTWAAMMTDWFKANPPARGSVAKVVYSDIGPTKEWGQPLDETQWRKFARYPLQIWQSPGFQQPDVVLVDGRFRSGCALATAFMTQKPVDLFFDDYVNRTHYQKVQELLGPPEITGRMAHFRVVPQQIPPERLLWIMKLMQNP